MTKSVRAVMTGLIVGAVLSFATDRVLVAAGLLPRDNLFVSTPVIAVVLAYRSVFNALGCYLTAKFAPSRPMLHALILGGIGTAISVAGAIATADMHLGPSWYAWTLAALALPAAWIGGKLSERGVRISEEAAGEPR